MVEWPLIGAFCIWIWFRFRREGGSFGGMTRRWRERVARYEEEAAREAAASRRAAGSRSRAWTPGASTPPSIRENEPPGGPD